MSKELLNIMLGIPSSFLAILFGDFTPMFTCLVVLLMCDIITGVLTSIYSKTKYGHFSSNGLFKGLIRKGLELVVIVVATQLDQLLGLDYLRTAVVMYIIITEAISITENAYKCGVPIPKILSNVLEKSMGEMEDNHGN